MASQERSLSQDAPEHLQELMDAYPAVADLFTHPEFWEHEQQYGVPTIPFISILSLLESVHPNGRIDTHPYIRTVYEKEHTDGYWHDVPAFRIARDVRDNYPITLNDDPSATAAQAVNFLWFIHTRIVGLSDRSDKTLRITQQPFELLRRDSQKSYTLDGPIRLRWWRNPPSYTPEEITDAFADLQVIAALKRDLAEQSTVNKLATMKPQYGWLSDFFSDPDVWFSHSVTQTPYVPAHAVFALVEYVSWKTDKTQPQASWGIFNDWRSRYKQAYPEHAQALIEDRYKDARFLTPHAAVDLLYYIHTHTGVAYGRRHMYYRLPTGPYPQRLVYGGVAFARDRRSGEEWPTALLQLTEHQARVTSLVSPA